VLPEIVDTVVALGAASREKAVAEVRSAIPLDEAQTARLAEALGRATGKTVEVKVVVDPTVQGGLVAQIDDTVIDGSVRRRLEQLRAAL
jgi:F-type H+-transporting ATPase subunit delta